MAAANRLRAATGMVLLSGVVFALAGCGSAPGGRPDAGGNPEDAGGVAPTIPGPPGTPTAERGDKQATVRWTAPANSGGSAISSYTVTANPGGRTVTTTGALEATAVGLSNGTSYTFTVTATNAVGAGPASEASNPVVPASVPGPPTSVLAMPGNGQATVSWSTPQSTGGLGVLEYTVTASPGGQTARTTGALAATVSGLTNGISYTFTVTATNAIGTGTGWPSNAVVPAAVPDAPGSVMATPGAGRATVQWLAPASNGQPITGYTVTASPGGFSATTAALSATVIGLTNGISYTFTVTATNAVGTGPTSSPSNPVVPALPVGAPGAPTSVTATPGNAEATVNWAAPASDGNSPITSYTVTSSPGGFSASTSGMRTATVSGLTNGTSYTFTVTATNAFGSGPASAPSTAVVPATVPGAPTAVTATAGDARATVSWSSPASNGGRAITGYTVTSSPASFTATTLGATSATVTGLTNGISYTFTVTATNPIGTGPASAPSSPVAPFVDVPGAPSAVTATAGNGQATVGWAAPASDGNSPITTYTVTSSPGGFLATSSTRTATVTGLTNGTGYTFTITATNAIGTGPASAPSSAIVPFVGVPGAPSAVTATAGNAQATVSWAAPASDGNSPITTYTVSSNPGGFTATTTGALTATVTGLSNGTSYTFAVTATNTYGTGTSSMASNAVTPSACPPPGVICAGVCVDLQTNFYNCGACGNSCGALFCTCACVSGQCSLN